MGNVELREEIRRLQARLDPIEVARQCDPQDGDVSESEEEDEGEGEAHAKVRLLKSMLGSISRPKLEVSTYDGILSSKNLIDQISELENYF